MLTIFELFIFKLLTCSRISLHGQFNSFVLSQRKYQVIYDHRSTGTSCQRSDQLVQGGGGGVNTSLKGTY